MQELTQDYVKQLFDYQDGQLLWKIKKSSNTIIGSVAGHVGKLGYVEVRINGRLEQAHRIIWCWHYGKLPTMELDHKDTNPSNNKIENLREATRSQNNGNTKIKRTNKSGFKGVSPYRNKFHAQITINQQRKHLGYFATALEAHKAYCEAANKYFGEFARTSL